MYAKCDLQKSVVVFGNTLNVKCHNVHMSDEISYDWSANAAKGMFGFPLNFLIGGVYKAGKGTKVKMAIKTAGNVETHMAVHHKIDKHWSGVVHQHFHTKRIGTT